MANFSSSREHVIKQQYEEKIMVFSGRLKENYGGLEHIRDKKCRKFTSPKLSQ
jgi:hypothetical protein